LVRLDRGVSHAGHHPRTAHPFALSCNSRVSLSSNSRLIGLARPPRPSTSRLVLVVSSTSRCIGLNRAPSSHVLCSRVRTLSVSILSQERRTFLAVGTLGRLVAKSSSPGLAFISLFRSPALLRLAPASLPRWICFLRPVARPRRSLRLLGPFDAYRCTLTRPSVRPCGLTPTGWVCLSQLCSCRASASRVSCWIVHGHPTFRGFSPLAAGTDDLPLA
jgi:hypothetical protein